MGQISEYTIVGMSASPLAGETDSGFVNLNVSTSLASLSKTRVSPMGLIGFLWVIWDREKQGCHDKFAGTYVVNTKTMNTSG